ncbi:hypothetical protein LTR16_003864, partial [Cryomyces antarcticus]
PSSSSDAPTSTSQAPAPVTTPTPPPNSTAFLPPGALDLATKPFETARTGQTSLLSQYLAAGIPPNLMNHNSDTLLTLASYHGQLKTVKMLLGRGADPNVVNQRGQSCLAGAVFKGLDGGVQSGGDSGREAQQSGGERGAAGTDSVVKLLFGAGADVNLGRPIAVETAKIFRREFENV